MSRACSCSLSFAVLLASVAAVHGEDAKKPRTDLYGDPLPPGAVMRLGSIRLRHAGADVAFCKDGKRLISCDLDGEVRVWDVATGRLLGSKQLASKPRRGQLLRLDLSSDGAKAAALTGQRVHLYNTDTGKEQGRFPLNAYNCDPFLMLSPDGRRLAVQEGSRESGFVTRLWDVAKCKKSQTLGDRRGDELMNIAFAPDGKRLAGAAVSGDLFLWDTATGKVLGKKEKLSAPLETLPLAFSPDGTILACASRLTVRLLNAATLKERARFQVPADVKDGQIERLAFSPDGRVLAGTTLESPTRPGPCSVFLWSVTGAKEIRQLPTRGRWGARLRFAPDSKTLACHDKTISEIQLWDVGTGRPLHQRPGHDQRIAVLAASPTGKVIASGDYGGVLRLWDAATGRQLRSIEARNLLIDCCLFSPDGKQVILADWADPFEKIAFQVWDVATGKPVRRIEIKGKFPTSLAAAAITADGKRLAAVVSLGAGLSTAAQLVVWDLATGRRLSQKPYKYEAVTRGGLAPYEAAYVAFAPDGERVGVWLGDRAGLEEIATGALLATLPKGIGQRGQAFVFSPDGRLAAVNGETEDDPSRFVLIETASGEEVLHLELEQCGAVAFTPDSHGVIVVDSERLSVRDTDTGKKLCQFALPQGLSDLVVALPGGRAATAQFEGDILVWDLAPATQPGRKTLRDLGREQLKALWSDLAGDARRAYRAISKLADAPEQTVPFMKDRLQPVTLDAKRLDKLLADLDSDSFAKREAASRELVRMRYRLDQMLRRALEDKPSLEMRRRLEGILAEPKRPPAEALRTLRAIAVLERIGTPGARRILEKLAGGAVSPETRAAQAALQRLNRRDAWTKEKSSP